MYYLCSKNECRMKKFCFTLLVFMTLFSAAKADPFRFGVVAGMNMTKGETSSSVNYKGWSPDTENGWFAGLQLKFSLPVVGLGFDASLIYSQETLSVPVALNAFDNMGGDYTGQVKTETYKMKYLGIPVHLRYDLSIPGANWVAVPFIFTGPQANIAVSKLDRKYNEYQDITSKDLVWRYDLGGGVILLKHLQAAYSYSFPLSKSYEGKFSQKTDQFNEDYKSGVHRISLTYFF